MPNKLGRLEGELIDIWTQVVGVAPAGTEEDFFAAGGDSIQAAALVARARDASGTRIDLGAFLARPTLGGLTQLIEAAPPEAATPTPPAAAGDGEPARCSPAQERFWFIDQATGSNAVSNVPWALRLRGPLDVPALERALVAVAARHDTLRTRFELSGGQPVQVVDPDPGLHLNVVAAADESEATRLAAAEAQVPFDLSRGPLLRATLVVLGPEEHVLVLVAHHIICDDWTKGVILSELGALYRGTADLDPPGIQYPEYARRQRERLDEAFLDAELAHWRERLAGAPAALELPTDRPRPPARGLRGARLRRTLDPDVAEALRALGRAHGATFYMTMLAALAALLRRYTGQDDLVIGTAIDGRGPVELEQAPGLFTNVLALRADLAGGPSFRELLARARATTLDAMAHQELPFDRLAAALSDRDPSRHPVFQVFYEFIVPAPLELGLPGISSEPFEVPKLTSEFDLGLYLDEQRGGLDAVWEYSTDLFEPATIARLSRHFSVLLAAIAAEPDRPVDELELLEQDERRRALVEWNPPAAPVPDAGIEELFEQRVRRAPSAPALVAAGVELSYGELNAQANRIAHRLRELGVQAGECVGLSLPRTPELVAALLGILKAGAAYVPLNPDHPPARLLAQLAAAQVGTLIADRPPAGFGGALLVPDDERLATMPSADPERSRDPERLAYVLYTSGSTGVPKGVAVTHRNLVNYTTHMLGALGEGGHFGSVSAVSTDLGNTAIFPALAGGGCLHLIPAETATDAAQFAAYVTERPLDVLKITPSHLGSLMDAAQTPSLLPRRWLVLGGEAFTWELAQRVSVPGGPRVMNHYGPTEATVGCCTYELRPGAPRPASATVPIGRPISGDLAYVLDGRMAPVPVGVPGELFVGGAGVARGYVGAPELTAERFVPNPFAAGHLYRTGDLVRHLAEGEIEFLGRVDEQVKIRGFRVEPAEVQSALMRRPGVRQAAVIALGAGEGKRLVAYVVGEARPDELVSALGSELPAYMVPATVLAVDRLPLTPNGKLDRAALPRPEDAAPAGAQAPPGAEPASDQEVALLAIWSELLARDVGPGDNFFDLGGHSLLAIRLIARIRKDLGTKLTLKALIEAPTVRELAARIDASATPAKPGALAPPTPPAAAAPPAPTVPRAPRDRPLRCSFVQEQLWLVDQLTPGSAAYNFSWPTRISGSLDREALARAVEEFIRRHEAMRTRFAAHDGQPLQVVGQGVPHGLEVIDLTGEGDAAATAHRLVDEYTGEPFDLARGPLLRVRLLVLGPEDHILQVVVHHIVFDGVSKVVLYRELGELYRAFSAGQPSPLEPPALQYADFAEWQRSSLDVGRVEEELRHWRDRLAGRPAALELPTDRPRPAVASLRGARLRVPLATELRERLDTLARRQRATFFTAMLAAFDVLLYRYSGQEDLVIGTPVDTRSRPELEPVIGPFINTVVIRSDLSGSPSFSELLARVQSRTLEAVEHQDLPFERLVAELAPDRDLSRHPIFQALIALNPPESGLALAGLGTEDIDPAWTASRVDLFLVLDDLPHGLEAIWEYSTDLFDRETVQRMADHFVRLLEAVVADPERPIGELPLLSESERSRLVHEWNRTAEEIPSGRLEELVAAQALRAPDRVAVECGGRSLTYAQLEASANRLAHRLAGLGAAAGERVGICLDRSEELPVALLATLKTGAAYVPIDPAFPPARQAFMLTDAQVRVLLTTEELLEGLPVSGSEVLCLDRDRDVIAAEPATAPPPSADASGLAYVIYTSGSTGAPKGVEIEHRALVNFLASMARRPGLGSEDVLVAVTTLSFDIAGLELYLPLLIGARVVIASRATAADPRALARLLERSQGTVMQATPTTWRMLVDSGWPGRPGLKALCGGEALPSQLAEELLERGVELWNMYGPTETTIWSTCQPIDRPGQPVTIGGPIANTTLYVMDRRGDLAPLGVPGELLIGGAGLARGYRGRPDLTAERFVADPFAGEAAAGRLYRTGDLVRRRVDGTIEFLGRLDQQVKLRGYRIELGEIEATLARHPAVLEAAAAVHTVGEEPALVGYVVGDPERVSSDELRGRLAESLPPYMVPSTILTLDRLPLTPNGKLDRQALPAPEPVQAPAALEPRTATERAVAELFAEVLGAESVGAESDFFGLGGQSLLAARVVSRIDARFELELPLRALFEVPTVAGLAARIDAQRAVASAPAPPEPSTPVPAPGSGDPTADDEPPPLLPAARVQLASFAQERFWFIDQVSGDSAAYNISWPLRLRGHLDVVALERALQEVVRRHEVLRSRFVAQDGRPMQVVEPAGSAPLRFVDLSANTGSEAELVRLVDAETQTPFDLERGPLLRTTLIRLSDDDHVLQVVAHHIVADGSSKVLFFEELGALYGALAENRPAALAELPIQYADFAQWQRSWLTGERLTRELDHWTAALEGLPSGLELPTDRPRPAVATLRGGWWRTGVPAATHDALRALAAREGATFFMVMLAAFDVLLYRYAGQEDVVVGTPVDTRSRPELERLIGPFVNTLVTRADLSGAPTFRELLTQVRGRLLDAIEHQALPFERLVERLAPGRELGRHPLFQALIALGPPEPAIQLAGLEVEELDTEKTTSRVDLTLLLQQHGDELDAVWEYASDLFDRESVTQMAEHFLVLLDAVVADPDCPVDRLALLPSSERAELIDRGSGAGAAVPVFCLHERFAEQAGRTPEAVAVSLEGHSLTYAELNRRANRLARRLRALGVGTETPVALCLERSLELPVAILGVLKAGGAYVPLDPEHPAERIEFVLDDCRAPVLITQESLLGRLPATSASVVCIDRDRAEVEREGDADPAPAATPENLAYVIYTSGSTGRPKGVLVEHRQVARLFGATEAWFSFGADDVWSLLHSYAFDFSVWELWGALLHGGRLVIVPRLTARSPDALAALLSAEGVTVLNATPSLFMTAMDELCAAGDELALRVVVFGGEALQTRLLEPWYRRFGDHGPQLVNMYGITETTVHVTYRPLKAADAAREGSPIGAPIPDLQLYLLDANLAPVPEGVAGELFVGGAGVARGYLNRPELTAERFLANPFGPGRLYRTGDRARWRRGEGLMFEGRLDDQVKIRGFRIELGEIQAALAGHDAVAECAVVPTAGAGGDLRLAAYVVPEPERAAAAALAGELRDWLRAKLPEYMVPASITLLDALPLTANGKLDRRALPAPSEDRAGRPAPTRTPTERDLAVLWGELLGVEEVGIHDDFFALGGHSLLAAQLAARIRRQFDANLSVRSVFEAPTVAGLAGLLDGVPVNGHGHAHPVRISPRGAGESWPLAYSQQQLWLLEQWDPGAPTYNVSLAFRLRGALDVEALRNALTGLLRRHEALRTVIEVRGDAPAPAPIEHPEVPFEVIDLPGAGEGEVHRRLTELARRPFEFARDPLLRCSVLRTSEDDQVVLLETHHIAFDGWSEKILLEELTELYQGHSLPEVSLQFGDFAVWQRRWLDSDEVQDELVWWRGHLAGAPTTIDLPTDASRPDGRRFGGATHDIRVPADIARRARALCREQGVTPYMLGLAALGTVLYRITGQDDILIGSPVANRPSVELEHLIGFFSNTLVFRARLGGNPTFAELLGRVREMALGVYAHQGVPLEKIVEAVGPERQPGVNPLFQVNLRVSTARRPGLELPGIESEAVRVDSGLARFDLALDLDLLEHEGGGYFRYNRHIFAPDTIARIAEEFVGVLTTAVTEPDRRLLSFALAHDWSARAPEAAASGGLRGFRAKGRDNPSPISP